MIGMATAGVPAFIPVFDWVTAATGESGMALVYGAIWQRALRDRRGECRISTRSLSERLGWTRKRVEQQLADLTLLGLIRCANPKARKRCYTLPTREEWQEEIDALRASPYGDLSF